MSHSGFATTRSMSKGLEDIVHSWERCCCVFHIFGKLSLSEAFYWRLMFHHLRNWKISPRWNLHEKMLRRSFLLTEDYIGKMHSNLKSDRKQTFQRKPLSGEIIRCRNRFDKELKNKVGKVCWCGSTTKIPSVKVGCFGQIVTLGRILSISKFVKCHHSGRISIFFFEGRTMQTNLGICLSKSAKRMNSSCLEGWCTVFSRLKI